MAYQLKLNSWVPRPEEPAEAEQPKQADQCDIEDGPACIHVEEGDADLQSAQGIPSQVPTGMRAVNVTVNDGSVTPGTRVDVLLTDEETTTVLQNVAVLATGHTILDPGSIETPVITLLVTPDDAERLQASTVVNLKTEDSGGH